MPKEFPCTLSLLASCYDVGFLEQTVRHVVRACRYPFVERLLNIDLDSGSDGVLAELRKICQRLIADAVIDRVVEFDRTIGQDPRISSQYFGRSRIRRPRDHRNIPLFGWISGIEACTSRYLLHFDCDILLYQQPGYSWIDEGVRLLHRRGDIMSVAPHPGPPASDGLLHQRATVEWKRDDGFLAFNSFTTRRYLIDTERFQAFLPIRLTHCPWKKRIRRWLRGKGTANTWESHIKTALADSRFCRADLDTSRAWTLHCKSRGKPFEDALPQIIERIERGEFPEQQAGHYNLKLDLWQHGSASNNGNENTDKVPLA